MQSSEFELHSKEWTRLSLQETIQMSYSNKINHIFNKKSYAYKKICRFFNPELWSWYLKLNILKSRLLSLTHLQFLLVLLLYKLIFMGHPYVICHCLPVRLHSKKSSASSKVWARSPSLGSPLVLTGPISKQEEKKWMMTSIFCSFRISVCL